MQWLPANNVIKEEGETETELTFSAGITFKNAAQSSEFYTGVLHVDDLGFGAGYRHFLK